MTEDDAALDWLQEQRQPVLEAAVRVAAHLLAHPEIGLAHLLHEAADRLDRADLGRLADRVAHLIGSMETRTAGVWTGPGWQSSPRNRWDERTKRYRMERHDRVPYYPIEAPCCEFLGSTNDPMRQCMVDLYWCRQYSQLIARHGEGSVDYIWTYPDEADWRDVARDAPVLIEARGRAIAAGFLPAPS